MVELDVVPLTERLKVEWENLVDRGDKTTIFQRYEWLKSLEEGLGLEPLHLIVRKNGGLIGGLSNFVEPIEKTPFKRLRSLPLGIGGPIILKHKKEAFNQLFQKIDEICRKENYVSHKVRMKPELVGFSHHFKMRGYESDISNCRFTVELENFHEKLSGRRKRDKEWIERNIENSEEFSLQKKNLSKVEIKSFFRLYKYTCKTTGANPLPIELFHAIRRNLPEENTALFTLTKNELVAGLLCILDLENQIIHPMFIGSKKKFKRDYKTHLSLYIRSMKWGDENEFKWYDTGVCPSNFENGLFKFKKEFGGTVQPDIVWVREYSGLRQSILKFLRKFYLKIKG